MISWVGKVEVSEVPNQPGVEEGNIPLDYSSGEESNKLKDKKQLPVEEKFFQLVMLYQQHQLSESYSFICLVFKFIFHLSCKWALARSQHRFKSINHQNHL